MVNGVLINAADKNPVPVAEAVDGSSSQEVEEVQPPPEPEVNSAGGVVDLPQPVRPDYEASLWNKDMLKSSYSKIKLSAIHKLRLTTLMSGNPCSRWDTEEDGEDNVRLILETYFESVDQHVMQNVLTKNMFNVSNSCFSK